MYADRYERAKPNPVSLTAAVGINAALVAALLFSVPELIPDIEKRFVGINIPVPPAPRPKPEPVEKTEATRDPVIATPKPQIPTILPPVSPVEGTIDPPPIPYDPGAPAGTGSATGVTVDPPRPAPVLTEALPDPRAEFQPDYPPSGRRENIQGAVTVRVLVGADGRVKVVEQVRSIGDAFFAATRRQALARWRFKPATRDGVPYETWRTMTVRFVLEG